MLQSYLIDKAKRLVKKGTLNLKYSGDVACNAQQRAYCRIAIKKAFLKPKCRTFDAISAHLSQVLFAQCKKHFTSRVVLADSNSDYSRPAAATGWCTVDLGLIQLTISPDT